MNASSTEEIEHFFQSEAVTRKTEETAGRLILVAFGWTLLAMSGPFLIGFVRGFVPAYVNAATHGAVQLQVPPVLDRLLVTVYISSTASVFLWASLVRGGVAGNGDRALGLAFAPIAWFPVTILLMVVIAAYGALLDVLIHRVQPDVFLKASSLPLWLTLLHALASVVIAPLGEEMFFRGFLWTGLRKYWNAPLTALFTAGAWLVVHVNVAQIVFLLVPALLISIARHVSGSVRATILIHATYNLAVNVPLIALMLDVFGHQG
jgi:membrane protease YdiL (CAAX protease family)